MCVLLCANSYVYQWLDLDAALACRNVLQLSPVCPVDPLTCADEKEAEYLDEAAVRKLVRGPMLRQPGWRNPDKVGVASCAAYRTNGKTRLIRSLMPGAGCWFSSAGGADSRRPRAFGRDGRLDGRRVVAQKSQPIVVEQANAVGNSTGLKRRLRGMRALQELNDFAPSYL